MATAIVGADVRIGIGSEVTEGTAVAATELYEYLGGDVGLVEEEINSMGMAGTRSRYATRTRAGVRRVTGSLTLQPNAIEWSQLLPRILGAAASGTTFALAEQLPSFTLVIDKDNATDGKTFTYNACKVSRAVLTAEQGRPLTLELGIEGWDESIGAAGTFPSLTLNTATGPFILSDTSGAITVGGAAYPFRRMVLTIDNSPDTERFMNSNIRSALRSKDRIISLELDGPYGNNSAIYPTAATLAAGVAVVIPFTNTVHAVSLSISLPLVHFTRRTPPLAGREEVMLPLVGQARATAANSECVITLDSTP
jgi:hypothetical protein